MTDMQTMTPIEALALALYLGVSAPDDDKMHMAVSKAERLAAGMNEADVAAATALAVELIADDPHDLMRERRGTAE